MCPTIVTGRGEGAQFVEAAKTELADAVGFRPFPGTLNVDRLPIVETLAKETVRSGGLQTDHCDGVVLRPSSVAGVRSAVLRPLMANYPSEKFELVAPVRLRTLFSLDDGDDIPVSQPEDVFHPNSLPATADALGEFDAVVFDLDGTLLDLDIDWEAVHDDAIAVLGDALDDPLTAYTRQEVLQLARESDRDDELHEMLTEHEYDGARTASKRPLLETASDLGCPVGICTDNAVSAVTKAVSKYGVLDDIDVISGRGVGAESKPLLRCLDQLGAAPGNAVFVGDERTDAETAVAGGSSFLHPKQFERTDGED